MTDSHQPWGEVARTAARFAERHIEPAAGAADHADPAFPDRVFAAGLAAGFDRLAVPESEGGHGFETAALCELVETLARTCAGHALVFGVHAAAVTSLHEAGCADHGDVLRDLLAGRRPVAVVFPHPESLDDFDTGLVASRDGGTMVITGDAGLAINASPAGSVLVFARSSGGEPLALACPFEGLAGGAQLERTLGLRAMPIAAIACREHAVAASCLAAEGERAVVLYRALLRNLCLVATAAAAGAMAEACARASAYAADRYQGGKMIADHSHLRAILGRMSAECASAHAAAAHAAAQPEGRAVIGAKAVVTDAAVRVCTDAVQVLGGYGYMRDYGLEKRMRDAAVLSLLPVSNAAAEQLLAGMEHERHR